MAYTLEQRMIVYLVEMDRFCSRSVVAVFSIETDAEEFCATWNKEDDTGDDWTTSYGVVAFTLDEKLKPKT